MIFTRILKYTLLQAHIENYHLRWIARFLQQKDTGEKERSRWKRPDYEYYIPPAADPAFKTYRITPTGKYKRNPPISYGGIAIK